MREPRKSIGAAVGLALRAHRESTGKTRAQFVAGTDWGSETLAAIETGRRLPTFERLVELVGHLRADDILMAASVTSGQGVATIRAVMSI